MFSITIFSVRDIRIQSYYIPDQNEEPSTIEVRVMSFTLGIVLCNRIYHTQIRSDSDDMYELVSDLPLEEDDLDSFNEFLIRSNIRNKCIDLYFKNQRALSEEYQLAEVIDSTERALTKEEMIEKFLDHVFRLRELNINDIHESRYAMIDKIILDLLALIDGDSNFESIVPFALYPIQITDENKGNWWDDEVNISGDLAEEYKRLLVKRGIIHRNG